MGNQYAVLIAARPLMLSAGLLKRVFCRVNANTQGEAEEIADFLAWKVFPEAWHQFRTVAIELCPPESEIVAYYIAAWGTVTAVTAAKTAVIVYGKEVNDPFAVFLSHRKAAITEVRRAARYRQVTRRDVYEHDISFVYTTPGQVPVYNLEMSPGDLAGLIQ